MYDRQIILIAHNIRSCHNVGSLIRTAEGLGIQEVILSGYTPYPLLPANQNDNRLPHEAVKISKQIYKTALGAEQTLAWRHEPDVIQAIDNLKSADWRIVAIEQADNSQVLPDYHPLQKVALLVGREVEGIEHEVLEICDDIVEIPMLGHKESYNVAQAAAMALYHCRFTS
jgi:23S rRNA (guanosine2251-2'-O)-methyltransferase